MHASSIHHHLLLLFLVLRPSSTARILAVPGWPSVSHENFLVPIWRELSLRGHQVTALTTRPLRDASLVNLTEIDVSLMYGVARSPDSADRVTATPWVWERTRIIRVLIRDALEEAMRSPQVRAMLDDEEVGFDLVMVEPHHPLAFAFAAKYRAPVIVHSTLGVFLDVHDSQGNPTHPVISPDLFVEKSPRGTFRAFFEKVISLVHNVWFRIYFRNFEVPEADRIARKYLGHDIPYLGDVADNVSLVLANYNPIMNIARPNVPSVVEIGQVHITKNVSLPKDLQEYLDSSKRGVVYFSLGTFVVTSNVENGTLETITKALGELPYNVLWKYEKDELPGKPSNVMIRKWLPQQAILNHPNVKVFITQGGLQSLEESIFAEVPIVGIPFMADQPFNIGQLVDKGLGEKLDRDWLTKENLVETIVKVATDPSYKANVVKAKRILEDQPIKGLEKVVWWVEYVLRHGRTDHLKGAAAYMSMVEYFMLDVIAFLAIVSVSVVFVIYKLALLLRTALTTSKYKKE